MSDVAPTLRVLSLRSFAFVSVLFRLFIMHVEFLLEMDGREAKVSIPIGRVWYVRIMVNWIIRNTLPYPNVSEHERDHGHGLLRH
jgi:hypothetical protein